MLKHFKTFFKWYYTIFQTFFFNVASMLSSAISPMGVSYNNIFLQPWYMILYSKRDGNFSQCNGDCIMSTHII